MAVFTPFSRQVQDELRFRRSFSNVQIPLIPHLRVTSLIKGRLRDFNPEPLRGLTLGPTDTSWFKNLENQTNITGTNSYVGTTYTGDGNSAKVYGIRSDKTNLSVPGVERVSIDAQKGGYVFKATVDLKCYGKEQYDFLYQTFTRPGTPILIEYGHTRNKIDNINGTLIDLSNLGDAEYNEEGTSKIVNGFFDTLSDDKVEIYQQMLLGFRSPISNRTGGSVVGLVSNFDVKLNPSNEYEISIELINPLEWFYNIQNNNTHISYDESEFNSKSVDLIFGADLQKNGDDYNPEFDTIFHIILQEWYDSLNKSSKRGPHSNIRRSAPPILIFGNKEDSSPAWRARSGEGDISEITENLVENNNVEDIYISLDYFLNELLTIIMDTSYEDILGVYDRLKNRAYTVIGGSEGSPIETIISPESYCTYWNLLRSNNTDVIINNKNLYVSDVKDDVNWTESYTYSSYYLNRRYKGYARKFNLTESEVLSDPNQVPALKTTFSKLFAIDPEMGPNGNPPRAEIYGQIDNTSEDIITDGQRINNFKGIYIRYHTIRQAFVGSNTNTLAESIVKVLNTVNEATNGVLNLKMRFVDIEKIPAVDQTPENSVRQNDLPYSRYELLIYDEASLPVEGVKDHVYTFFENDISEAISYDLKFNLPSAVASIVVANDFESEYAAGGDLKNKIFIDYGYDPGITKLISDFGGGSNNANGINSEEGQKIKHPQTTSLINVLKKANEQANRVNISSLIGYLELHSPSVLGQLTQRGLYNTLPSAAKVTITLQGISGIKWGQLFGVENILPGPYDKNSLFMVVGYEHNITSDEWHTTITGQLIASPTDEFISQRRTFADDQLIYDPPQLTEDQIKQSKDLIRPWDQVSMRGLDPRWYPLVQNARKEFERRGYTFNIISGYRTEDQNEDVGGVPNSKHLTYPAKAIDVNIFDYKVNPQTEEFELGRFYSKEEAYDKNSTSYKRYAELASVFAEVGLQLKSPVFVRWGGNFSINDPNHYDIP